jgi:uroporphyrinogen-III decarboxylase
MNDPQWETLLGNLPPRDVLAKAAPEAIQEMTRAMIDDIKDRSRVILSCGGGMPPGVSTENINAFIGTVESLTA